MRRMRLLLGLPLLGLLALNGSHAPVEALAPPRGADDAGIARAQRYIAEREYHASANARGLQAPNRAHDLRSYFDAAGVRVHDRTAPGEPRLVALSLAGVGRGAALAAPAPAEVSHAGARVELRRPGLIEWYENRAAGLEQGFTLEAKPSGAGALVLELGVNGARVRARGEDVVFATSSGRRLAFAKLRAEDADGRALPARFEIASASRLLFVVDDANARFPLVIDPLLTGAPDAQFESDQASAVLGSSVDGAGDVNGDGFADVIVGAPGYDAGETDEGAAFVFHGSAAGIADANPSAAATQLEANQASARLGFSVAGAGDVNGDGYADVIVSANGYDAGEAEEGAAFVFHGGSDGIPDASPSTAASQLEPDQASADFGESVASAGDVNGDGYADVIVGAPLYDAGETDEGAAFVFHGSGSGIPDGNPSTAPTQLESNQASAFLGFSVAGAGDVDGNGHADVIVGAMGYDAGETNEGAAFVFSGSGSGVPDGNPSTAPTQFESNQVGAFFGLDVAGAGDVNGDGMADVIVGTQGYDAGETDEGAAFVFLGSFFGMPGGNPSTAASQLESNQASASFGRWVTGAGDVNGDGYADVAVSAPTYDDGETNEGAAFVFYGSSFGVPNGNPGTAPSQVQSDQAFANLGYSLGAAGDVNGDGFADLVVGAQGYDAGDPDEGAAFVFHGGAEGVESGTAATANVRLASANDYARFGCSVASAGDVNGDGFADVIVGARRFDGGEANEGAAFVFHGSASGIASGLESTAATRLESNQAEASFGESVASAGDVNGDGYADVIVGAPDYDAGQTDEGGAFVFHGASGGIPHAAPPTAAARLEGNQADAGFGTQVAGAGDADGDGFGDVIVGAPGYDAGEADEGAAFVFYGDTAGIGDASPSTAPTQLEANQVGAELGRSVAGAGDVNGDGLADVIVGAPAYDAGETDEGEAFVFHGNGATIADGSPNTAPTWLESNQAGARLGDSVAGAGDVNGDGLADVIVGAPRYDSGGTDSGAAFVFHGSGAGVPNGSPSTAPTQLEASDGNARLGESVAGAGDVNGDGYADVIVAAPGQTDGVHSEGEGTVCIFQGSASGIADGDLTTAPTRIDGEWPETLFAGSVAGAGDVNGDGYADVIVGADHWYIGVVAADAGAVFAFLGNGDGDGRPVLARQLRTSNDLPLQPWTRAQSAARFRVTATHPEGRGRVKLQLEHCPPARPFGTPLYCATITQASWTTIIFGSVPVTLTSDLAGLPSNVVRRWRARVLYAPPTGAPPLVPAHGPWRRVHAQAVEADFRTALPSGGGGGCGIGPELALLLPVLLALGARRRARR